MFHDSLDEVDRRAPSLLFWTHVTHTDGSASTWRQGSISPAIATPAAGS